MARVPDILCAGTCGKLLWGGTTSLPQGEAMCRECRKATREHGTRRGYRGAQCRCSECRAWQAKQIREYASQRKLNPSGQVCANAQCARDTCSRGMCKKHYAAWARGAGMTKPEAWNDRKRDNMHRRRALLYGYTRADQRAMLSQVIERDGNTCTGCQQPVDLTLTWPNRMYKSLDHIIPLSKGGEHSLDNAALMHHRCNSAKGSRVA